MASNGSTRRRRSRGEIETLPSGSLRVRVYAGLDPISGKRRYLTEVVPAGKNAAREAEKIRTRFQAQVDEQRSPRTNATVTQLMDRYLEMLQVEDTTRSGYEGLYRLHIQPLLGRLSVGKIDGETLDSFYTDLRRCRTHCDGSRGIDHRTNRAHECDERCSAHRCRPMSTSSVRQIHSLLNGAFTRAVRWRWIGTNPVQQAEPPPIPRADPQPPTPAQAAAIVTKAWTEPNWGMLVWLAMTTGARRGELCALRWRNIDFGTGVLDIGASIGQLGARVWEKDTKTHQRRRIVLDVQTVGLLRAYLDHRTHQATLLEITLADDAFVFSPEPDGRTALKPNTVTQRYRRMCSQLGWDMHIHQLRHFSATELIAAGVDVRTVAGRLGHSGGGTTTLRVYSAWVAEADQRAATSPTTRLPSIVGGDWTPGGEAPCLPAGEAPPAEPAPYQQITDDLRSAIRCGALKSGDLLPTTKDLIARYGVSAGTANRAFAVLRTEGLIAVARGRRAVMA
jgi:integrase